VSSHFITFHMTFPMTNVGGKRKRGGRKGRRKVKERGKKKKGGGGKEYRVLLDALCISARFGRGGEGKNLKRTCRERRRKERWLYILSSNSLLL